VEAIGVTCLLRGNHGARKFGWTCLESAILLRLSQLVPFKTSYHTSPLEKRVFGNVRQVKTIEELNALKCKTSLREIEALGLHTLKRFLTKYNRFSPMILPSKVSTLFLKGTFLLDEMLSSGAALHGSSLCLYFLSNCFKLTL
jgi:hypothetical protein